MTFVKAATIYEVLRDHAGAARIVSGRSRRGPGRAGRFITAASSGGRSATDPGPGWGLVVWPERCESRDAARPQEGNKMASIYEEVKAAGGYIPDHESDLYIEDTAENRAILARYPLEKSIATRFKDNVTGKPSIEIPFAFMPFWEARAK